MTNLEISKLFNAMNLSKLILSLSLCFFVALLGSAVTMPSISTWYLELNKPFFNPPNWVFGPVWTILYALMGISLYLVWSRGFRNKKVSKAVKIFLTQLALNFTWSLVFFGLHLPSLAFVIIITLWICIFLTIRYFYVVSKVASYLLYPYLFWVSFAAVLNLAIAFLN